MKIFNLRFIVLLFITFFYSQVMASEELEVWHGWMNLTPCSRASGYEDDFGNWWPNGVEVADQEFHGYIYAIVPSAQDVTNEVRNSCIQCGLQAAAVTTAVSILTEGAGGWESFNATFWDCINNRTDEYVQRVVNSITLRTRAQCNW